MLKPFDYTLADTRNVLNGAYGAVTHRGNPWIDSPLFDALAGERFGK